MKNLENDRFYFFFFLTNYKTILKFSMNFNEIINELKIFDILFAAKKKNSEHI